MITIAATNLFLRIIIAFTLIWGVLRILGKKEMGRITYYNMATAATLGTLAGGLIADSNTNPLFYVAGLLGMPLLTFIVSYISLKSPKARVILEGKPTVVISKGKILEDNLHNMRLSSDNLLQQLRQKKAFSVGDVEFAVMEPDGKMSVLLSSQQQPLTPRDLGLSKSGNLPICLIKEGMIIDNNLQEMNLSRAWLIDKLNLQGISSIEQVYLAQVDSMGKLYVDQYSK